MRKASHADKGDDPDGFRVKPLTRGIGGPWKQLLLVVLSAPLLRCASTRSVQGPPRSAVPPCRAPLAVEGGLDDLERARTCEEAGHVDEALSVLRRAALVHPEDADLQSRLGDAYYRAGLLPWAALAYGDVLTLSPRSAHARFRLGVIADRLGDRSKAAAWYRAAIAVEPQDPRAHYNLAALLAGPLDQPEEALRHFETALTAPAPLPEEDRRRAVEWLRTHRP